MASIAVALDAMGGDFGISVTIPAALQAIKKHPDLTLTLVGEPEAIKEWFSARSCPVPARITICPASQVVTMDEVPSQALRSKKDSSMRVAINLVKEGRVMACVSAGNTGALMAIARYVLKTIPGIDRPAISALLPTANGSVRLLDLGANVDSSPEHLVQFAMMGSVLAESVNGIAHPRVGLLNIGAEEIKGNELVKQTAQSLGINPDINYIGYVEGDAIFQGVADVVVCDGFVGNVALKTTEGLARMIAFRMKQVFSRHWLTRIIGTIALPVLSRLKETMDPSRYNGASLVGLQGIVIKSHGSANVEALAYAIDEAILQVTQDIPRRLCDRLSHKFQLT